jgi:toxin YoeB
LKIVFSEQGWEDYRYWADTDSKLLKRLNGLIDECARSPFRGTGKPEPLKNELQGWWSRRVTKADRLVYRVTGKGSEKRLEIAQCRYHY